MRIAHLEAGRIGVMRTAQTLAIVDVSVTSICRRRGHREKYVRNIK
jgi:hypothetical protein